MGVNEREVGQRLVAILRKRHPDLAFEVGIQDGGRFRPLPSGMAEIHRLEPATDDNGYLSPRTTAATKVSA